MVHQTLAYRFVHAAHWSNNRWNALEGTAVRSTREALHCTARYTALHSIALHCTAPPRSLSYLHADPSFKILLCMNALYRWTGVHSFIAPAGEEREQRHNDRRRVAAAGLDYSRRVSARKGAHRPTFLLWAIPPQRIVPHTVATHAHPRTVVAVCADAGDIDAVMPPLSPTRHQAHPGDFPAGRLFHSGASEFESVGHLRVWPVTINTMTHHYHTTTMSHH